MGAAPPSAAVGPGPGPGLASAPVSLVASARLADLRDLVLRWPQLRELELASTSPLHSYRLRHAATSLVACGRAEMTAALLAERARGPLVSLSDDVGLAVVVLCGAARHDSLSQLLDGGLDLLAASWGLEGKQLRLVSSLLRSVVAPPVVFGSSALPLAFASLDPGPEADCALSTLLFGAAIQAGWPWALTLRLFAGLRRGRTCKGGHGFIPERGKAAPPNSRWMSSSLSSDADPSLTITLFFDHDGFVFLLCNRAVFGSPAQLRGPVPAWLVQRRSRWLPEFVRMEVDAFGIPLIPRHRVTSLVERRHLWERLIKMDGITRAVVMGKLCYPRTCWLITPSYLPNHKSWEVDEVKKQLGMKQAAYFFQGALEFIFPGHPLPTLVEPKGAVPKKGRDKYRDIADGRRGNKTLADWGSRFFTARDLAAALWWRAILFGHDINDGYHIAPLTGCTGELVVGWGIVDVVRVYPGDDEWETPVVKMPDGSFQPAFGPHGPQARFVFGWRLHVGCWSGSCCQTCDKSFTGMFFDGCLARWAVAHFGQKPAGCPLNCVAICLLRHAALRGANAGELRGASLRSLLGVVWVDDFAFYHQVAAHPACGGLADGCPSCMEALAQAEVLDEWWMDLCDQLGVSLNLTKHQRCAQSVEYSGFRFDTLLGRMLTLPDKQASLLAACEVLGATSSWTLRALDSVKGRLLHYSAAIRHLRVLVSELGRLMGPVSEELYDVPMPAPAGLAELAVELADCIARFAPSGSPLWPAIPSSAYSALLSGSEMQAFCSLTWDASPDGWAALARWWDTTGPSPVLRELLLIGSWPADWDVSQQAFREALGGVLAFEAFVRAVDIRGRLCILRNDASAAVAAFRKGSSQSPPMQRCALRLNRAAADTDVDLAPWHVPGLQLIAEGIDDASRSGDAMGDGVNLAATLGPAVSDDLWAQVLRVASAVDWTPTVDAFATESNARTDRFWARFAEPGCDALDALSVLDWAQSACPACGGQHREVVYAFPPLLLLRATIEKACADAALCVLVVPLAVLAPHWNKLLAASLLSAASGFPAGFARVRRPGPLLLHADGFDPTELAVFACDFGRIAPRAGLPPTSTCPGAFTRRLRPVCGSARDQAERARLRDALLSTRDVRWSDDGFCPLV